MLPLRLVPRLFMFDDDELEPEFRSQRTLNKSRVPAITQYIINHPDEYVFSAITASIDAEVLFLPISDDPALYNVGALRVPLDAKFVINDGQHRRAAIELALKERPILGDETISCVLFQDSGLKRSQQMFADLNRYAVRPTQSIGILYDHRDQMAEITKRLAVEVEIFRNSTELDRSSISNRSVKIFTLSGIHRATTELLKGYSSSSIDGQFDFAFRYWTEVGRNILPWQQAKKGRLRPNVLRQEYIVGHAVALGAFGRVGRVLTMQYPSDWDKRLAILKGVDWNRSNTKQWEGRVTVGGRISIAGNHVVLLSNEIKKILGVMLEPDEATVEEAFLQKK